MTPFYISGFDLEETLNEEENDESPEPEEIPDNYGSVFDEA